MVTRTKEEIKRDIEDLEYRIERLTSQGEYKGAQKYEERVQELKRKLKSIVDDNDATESNPIEQYDKSKKGKEMRLSNNPIQANDDDEKWITVKGAHVKIGKGESKGEAVKKFIKSKGGDPAPAKKSGSSSKSDIKHNEGEVSRIKKEWSGKEYTPGHGSEYGDILNHLEKSNKLPDIDKYWEKRDELLKMRNSGKRDTPEYSAKEKELKEFNKEFNKKYSALEKRAYELSSEGEKQRLRELDPKKYGKSGSSKDSDPRVTEAMKIINLCGGAM